MIHVLQAFFFFSRLGKRKKRRKKTFQASCKIPYSPHHLANGPSFTFDHVKEKGGPEGSGGAEDSTSISQPIFFPNPTSHRPNPSPSAPNPIFPEQQKGNPSSHFTPSGPSKNRAGATKPPVRAGFFYGKKNRVLAPVSRKSLKPFGPEKPFVKLRPAYSLSCSFYML